MNKLSRQLDLTFSLVWKQLNIQRFSKFYINASFLAGISVTDIYKFDVNPNLIFDPWINYLKI